MTLIGSTDAQRASSRFIRRSMAEPLLSREEEFGLARAWRDERDEEALHRLIRSYMRLVVAVAARFRNYGLPMGDLVQEGAVGLMQAAARFEPEREVRFSTYATWWIRSSIQDFILRNWSIVRTGTTASQKTLFFNLRRLRAKIEETNGEGLDDAGRQKIAEHLSVDRRDVEQMELRLATSDQSLNGAIGESGDDEWQDLLADERPDPEANTIVHHDGQRRTVWLKEAMGHLDQRERMIIEARRLTDDAVTLEDLGRQLGVSKERVRQLEHRALLKLRSAMIRRSERPTDLLIEA